MMIKDIAFPPISTETLAGVKKTLPDDSRGLVTLIAIAFERPAQVMIDSWVEPFQEEFGRSGEVAVYEVPIIDSPVWKMMRGMIDGGMRAGIPLARHNYVMTYYGSSHTYRSTLGMKDRSIAYMFLLDDQGVIRWSGKGFATKDELENLITTARSLLRHMAVPVQA